MPVNVGKVLRELYLSTGLKMERFREAVTFSNKTIYYHFRQKDLNTAILRRYEAGLKKLGKDVDIWQLLADKSREDEKPVRDVGNTDYGEAMQDEPQTTTAEPVPDQYRDEVSVADLLRKAAYLLDMQQKNRKEEHH